MVYSLVVAFSEIAALKAEAMGILHAAGLRLVNKSLQMAYDSHGLLCLIGKIS